ncbi:Fc.00g031310.m01.CDS01 [Cosmosporella sp. VM-42]
MASRTRKTIAIIGSAIAGPTLALQILSNSLLRSTFRPVLYDQSPAPGKEGQLERNRAGATVGLFANGLYPLHRLGLENTIKQKGFECGSLVIWDCDYAGGHEKLNIQKDAMWSKDLQKGVVYFERHDLQALLVQRVKELGGEVFWEKKAVEFDALENEQTKVAFADGTDVLADLLVGADGGYSAVRRFILNQRNKPTAEERWLPDFMGLTGFYGVGTAIEAEGAIAKFDDSHSMWLDGGFLATGPCPDGKIRWDLVLTEKQPPTPSSGVQSATENVIAAAESWQSAIIPSQYPYNSTIDILRQHRKVFHPFSGNLEALFNSADRIIRTPLRQRVWKQDEIQWGSVVLLGDAARLMLPTSGQGTGFAIEDATVLAKTLLKLSSSSVKQPGYTMRSSLEEYARLREPRSKKMATAASLAASWGTGSSWYWRAMRYGMKWMPDTGEPRKKKGKDPWPFNERIDLTVPSSEESNSKTGETSLQRIDA